MAQRENLIFWSLQIIAWIIFVGLCIEAGGLLVNFVFSIYNPEFVPNLYQKLDLSDMYSRSTWAFYEVYGLILFIALLKVYLFYIVGILMYRIDLSNPFSNFVSEQISRISYCTFSVGLFSVIGQQVAKNLQHHGYTVAILSEFWADGRAFILMAAVIYVIAVIFRKGVEIQKENDLTV